jgi:DNA-binding response OmpR family regulator
MKHPSDEGILMRVAPIGTTRPKTLDPDAPTPLGELLKRGGARARRFPPIVLLIDDTVDQLDLYEAALRDRYEVLQAERGDVGIEIAFAKLPDIVVVDLSMPDVDGWEVCRRLRADQRTASIPVIILTALDVRDLRHEAMKAGVTDLLTKPCPVDTLRERIGEAIGRSA